MYQILKQPNRVEGKSTNPVHNGPYADAHAPSPRIWIGPFSYVWSKGTERENDNFSKFLAVFSSATP